MTKELREKIQEIMFATCPVDTEEPFFWKWNEHGLDMLESFYEQEIIEAERRMKEKCLECVPLGMTYYDDLTQKDYRDGYNQGVDDSRTAISSLK